MSKEVLHARTRSVEVDDTLYVRDDHLLTMFSGRRLIASEDEAQVRVYTEWIRQIARRSPGERVAHIGAGTCWLPRVLGLRSWECVDIYEIEQAVIDWNQRTWAEADGWNFILGDYRETIRGTYDIIIVDLPDHDEGSLQDHLTGGGLSLRA